MKTRICLTVLLAGLLATALHADEGMWLFNAFPKDKVQAKYGFAPDQAWLDHVRLASLRADLVRLDLEPVLVGSADPADVHATFLDWAHDRLAVARGAL